MEEHTHVDWPYTRASTNVEDLCRIFKRGEVESTVVDVLPDVMLHIQAV
jgi:hypothetical protein